MSTHPSVTTWLGQLKEARPEAAQKLWEHYFGNLVAMARNRLRGGPRGAADEEDVALSAFDSFFRGVQAGRFPRLEDRDDLWQVLLMIAERKVYDLLEHEGRAKRDWRRVVAPRDGEAQGPPLQSPEPDPALVAQMKEQLEHLMAALDDQELRDIARMKMEGLTNAEIARELDCSVPTVERRLQLIRKTWAREGLAPDES